MKLHLGCGENHFEGWINVDIDSPIADRHTDLRKPLPYYDHSIDFIFNEHFIEHLKFDECLAFLSECFRVLVKDGILRVSTPDLRNLVNMYLAGNITEWADIGYLPESPCILMNDGVHRWGHRFMYDLPELNGMLKKAGFNQIKSVGWRESDYPELCNLECRPFHGELIIEARKE